MIQKSHTATSTVLALDLGSINLRGALLDAGDVSPRWEGCRPVRGRLAAALGELLDELTQREGAGLAVRLQITGAGRDLLQRETELPATAHNEIVALSAAARVVCPEVRSLFEIGGHNSRWVMLAPDGEIQDYALSEACAAGTGAFIEQQAARLRLDPAGLSAAAMAAEQGVPVAGRCSVFAKSDMIHLQQKGVPVEEIAYGLCLAVARNLAATLLRGRTAPPPAALVGGCAANAGLARAMSQVLRLEQPISLPTRGESFAVLGAALSAPDDQRPVELGELTTQIQALKGRRVVRSAASLPRLDCGTLTPAQVDEPRFVSGAGAGAGAGDATQRVEGYLGVDVGSVSTNLVVMDRDCEEVLDGIYLRTRGRPVEVLQEGLAQLQERFGADLQVLGTGTTGSGRHLAAGLLGADVVLNEISCQLTSALHYVPEVDTVIEIGGQDSKFIRARGGRLQDFTMNKICAAGTGSFLEEEAARLDVSVKEGFTELALAAQRPANLGCRCTVFMDTDVVNAQSREVPPEDLCAGLAYAIARNYLERVVERRPIGTRVVMQGGVASNQAVVAAFSQLLGQEVTVHPHNRISGAIGAALAARQLQQQPGAGASAFRGLAALQERPKVKIFECPHCDNRCQVSRITLGQGPHPVRVHFGDACERYAAKDGGRVATSAELPDLFAEREALLRQSLRPTAKPRATVGLPRASALLPHFPFWSTLLAELGYHVVTSSPSSSRTLAAGIARLPAETCLPVKLAFGHVQELVDRGVDAVFCPSTVEISDWAGEVARGCPYVQALPHMLRAGIDGPLLIPEVNLDPRRLDDMVDQLQRTFSPFAPGTCARFEINEEETGRALRAAAAEQFGVISRLRARGAALLDEIGADGQRPRVTMAILGKPYHLSDAFLNLNLARHLRRLGVLAIPLDALPLPWSADGLLSATAMDSVPWRYSRDILRALLWTAEQPDLYPVVISSFGCGLDAFTHKQLERICTGLPHLELELDEHRAEAGLITRLEAFIDEIQQHRHEAHPRRSVDLSKAGYRPISAYRGRRVFVPYLADHSRAFAAAFRAAGVEATVLPLPDEALLERARRCASGKECHPWAMIAADLDKLADDHQKGDVFFVPGSTLPCLVQQYGVALRLLLQERGLGDDDVELFSPHMTAYLGMLGLERSILLYEGMFAIDILIRASCALRPYELRRGDVDAAHAANLDDLEQGMASGGLAQALRRCGERLRQIELAGRPGTRPVVGVAGDIYSRINPSANRDLFRELERMGCEVWPASFMVDFVDRNVMVSLRDSIRDHRPQLPIDVGLKVVHLRAVRFVKRHLGQLPGRDEPTPQEYETMAAPYLGYAKNLLIQWNVAKMVDFARRGASGIVNAAGENCMVGTVSAAITRRLRAEHGGIPLITPFYGATESDAIRASLEAFTHQVRRFHASRSGQPAELGAQEGVRSEALPPRDAPRSA